MQRKFGAMLLALLLIICQFPQIKANAAVSTNELKISSEITQWVLDEPANTLYAISQTGQALYFINATTMSIEKTLPLNTSPTDIIKDNGKLYISFAANQIVVVDMASRTISETLNTLSDTYRIVKDGSKLYYTEYDQWCEIYEYDLLAKQDKMIASLFYKPDIAINTNNHVLYIGESGLSGSNMTYYNINEKTIIGETNYNDGYGFYDAQRTTLFDGTNVYYAGRDFTPDNPTRFNGDFGIENVIYVNNGLVFTSKSVYDKETHKKLGDYAINATLVETSNSSVYVYSKESGIIKRFIDSSKPVNSSNIISLVSGTPAVPIQNTVQAIKLNANTSQLQMNSKLIQWQLDESSNTLYGISNEDKAIFFVNAQNLNLEKSLSFRSKPTDIIKDNGKIYVALDDSNQIAVVDMATRTVTDTLYTTSDPFSIVKDGDRIYYAERGSRVYEFNLITRTDKAIPIGGSSPDLAVNTIDHILYAGGSGSSGSNMSYYSTTSNTVISRTNYHDGYGFSSPLRNTLFDGTNVYYAGRDFNAKDATRFDGDFGSSEAVIYAKNGLVYTNNSIYDKNSHVRIGNYGSSTTLVEASDNAIYIYNKDNGTIRRFSDSSKPAIDSSNIIPLISGIPTAPIQATGQSILLNKNTSMLQLNSKLAGWKLDEGSNTLYGISNDDKALFFVNAQTLNLEKSLTFKCRPTDIVSDNGKIYVAMDDASQIAVVDIASRAITEILYTTSDPYRIVKDGNKLYYAESDQLCDIFEYDLTTNLDKILQLGDSIYKADIAVNTKDHLLYIGASNGSNMVYYSINQNNVIGKTNHGFPNSQRDTVFDGSNVYYAGRDFMSDSPTRFNGDFGNNEDVIYANNGLVYTSKSIYDKDSHVKLGNYSSSITLVEGTDKSVYFYNKDNGTISRFNDSDKPIDRSNIITLISGVPAVPIQNTAQSIQLDEDTSMLQMNSKLIQWELDEASNTLYGISEVDKAVFFVNAQSLNLEKSLTFQCRPTDVIRDRGKLYVALDDANRIVVIDMKTRTIIDTLYTTSDPYRIVKDGNKLYYTERDQWCDIYEFNLLTKTDKTISIGTIYQPDIAINPYNHILYIGESSISSCSLVYYSTVTNTIISRIGGYGFSYLGRHVLFDGERVYYGGRDFDMLDAGKILGTYSDDDILFAEYGMVFTKTGLYDSETHQLLGSNGGGFSLYEISNRLVIYFYDEVNNAIIRIQPNPMPFLVTFDSQLGVALQYLVDPNTTISAPVPPTRTGYTFGGWYKEPECIDAWDFTNDIVTQDTTLYARWLGKEDTNRDGKVDMLDLALIAKQYNTASGKAGWNSSYDLNNDGAVNIYDLVLISKCIRPASVKYLNKEQVTPAASNIGKLALRSLKNYK